MVGHIHWERNIGRRFQLRDLQIFFAVADRGSMAKAAAQLGVTQPSVSTAIAGLETSLGVRLFNRSSGGVELTQYGQVLLTRGRVAFDELRQGIRDIEFLREPDVGEVRIGCPEVIAAGFLPAVIDLLSQRHPRISLAITQVVTPTLEFRELKERKLDLVLAVLATPDSKNLAADYTAEILFDERLCVIVGRKSKWARRRKLNIAELSDEPWITGLFDSPGTAWVAEAFRAQGANFPKRCMSTYSVHIRNNLVATGRFISTMSESAFDNSAERFGLKMLPIELPAPRWPVAAITLRDHNLSPVVNLFLDCARFVAKARTSRGNLPVSKPSHSHVIARLPR
jgi:DNA-binding transcriptional LysR family regulator